MNTHLRNESTWLVLIDFFCLFVSCVLAVVLRLGPGELFDYVYGHIDAWILFFGSVILAHYLAGSYRIQYTFSRFNLAVMWCFAMLFACMMIGITSFAWFRLLIGRGVFGIAVLTYGALSLYVRLVVYRKLFCCNYLSRRVAIVGVGAAAQECRRVVENPYVLPRHEVVAWLAPWKGEEAGDRLENGLPVIATTPDKLAMEARRLNASMVVLAVKDLRDHPDLFQPLRRLRYTGVDVMLPLGLVEAYSGKTRLDYLDDDEMVRAIIFGRGPVVSHIKRLADLCLAGGLLFITSPLLMLSALITKLSAPGAPVFYHQVRVGRFGQLFTIHKIRTMTPEAEDQSGVVWSAPDDPRITPFGRFLRKYRIDEFPQLWNIIKGDMSLVGPRPERPEIVAQLSREIHFYDERENVMPGLTGWAQIQYPYGNSVDDTRHKLEYDLYYIRNLSLTLDLQIILRTIRTVLFGMEKRGEKK